MIYQPVIERSIEISASAEQVWRILTDPDLIARWMLGTRVESTWEPGAPIIFFNELHGRAYRDRGTILAIEPGRLLSYSHWAELAGIPDVPENRSVVTLRLERVPLERVPLERDGDITRLAVHHDRINSYEAYGHARFFWGYALRDMKSLAETGEVLNVREY